jgi:putative MATE family efflux protein
MNRIEELRTEKISKLLYKYFIPTVFGMLVVAVHITIDGIFIGRGIGSVGVAAVNIVVPFFTVYTAIGLMFGIGGATLVSIEYSRNNFNKAKEIFTSSVAVVILIGVVMTILTLIFRNELAILLGANKAMIESVNEYFFVIILFTPVYMLGNVMNTMVRADGSPKFGMICTVVGAVINGVFDYIAIFKMGWGLTGAAAATGIGNIVSLLMLVYYFKSDKSKLGFVKTRLRLKVVANIAKIGVPSFITEMGISVMTMYHNITMVNLAGENGVAAYGVINYIYPVMMLLFWGLSVSMQPVISYNHGAGLKERVKESISLVLKISIVMGVVFFIIGIFFNEEMVRLFIRDQEEVVKLASRGVVIYFFNFIFLGFNMAVIMYYQAIEKPIIPTVLTILRGFVIVLSFLYILPKFFGTDGVWMTIPATETLVFIIIVVYEKMKSHRDNGYENVTSDDEFTTVNTVVNTGVNRV